MRAVYLRKRSSWLRYAWRMHMIFDSFWRALLDCFRGKVIAWSLFPLVLLAVMAALFGWLWWDTALSTVQHWLEHAGWLQSLWAWLEQSGAGSASSIIAGVLIILVATPVMVMISLGVVAVVMTPRMVELVAQRRFAHLARKQGGNWISSALWAMASTAVALVALLVSIPLWLVPPLVLILPPLIWGWLTYRVMTYDALSEHASKAERQLLFEQHRYRLLLMGVVCGFVGAAPSVIWASGVLFAAAFWLLIPVGVWIYALVFAFSSLWFAHYGLAALQQLRGAEAEAVIAVDSPQV